MVRASEIETGLRKLFVLRLDDEPAPSYLADFQIQTITQNFVIDFHKLMMGILAGHSYYTVMDNARNEVRYDGQNVVMWIDGPREFLKFI